jgi:hypothetical protein
MGFDGLTIKGEGFFTIKDRGFNHPTRSFCLNMVEAS